MSPNATVEMYCCQQNVSVAMATALLAVTNLIMYLCPESFKQIRYVVPDSFVVIVDGVYCFY